MDLDYMAYQLQYDSTHGKFIGTVSVERRADESEFLLIDGNPVQVFRCKNPSDIPWGKAGATYVCESTGIFTSREKASAHLAGGASKVVISAPPKDDTPMCAAPPIEALSTRRLASTGRLSSQVCHGR